MHPSPKTFQALAQRQVIHEVAEDGNQCARAQRGSETTGIVFVVPRPDRYEQAAEVLMLQRNFARADPSAANVSTNSLSVLVGSSGVIPARENSHEH